MRSTRARPIAAPARRISPAMGWIRPETARSSVVLPWPFGPMMVMRPPSGTANEMSRSTRWP